MIQKTLQSIEKKYIKKNLPRLRIGDTVKVSYKIIEGKRERIQIFEGVIIAFKHGGINRSIKIRKISYNVGVERTFALNSPKIAKIEVVRHGRVRRAKLFYLRDLIGSKATRLKSHMRLQKDAMAPEEEAPVPTEQPPVDQPTDTGNEKKSEPVANDAAPDTSSENNHSDKTDTEKKNDAQDKADTLES